MHDLIIRRIPVGGRELLRLDAGLELKKEKQGLFFFLPFATAVWPN